MTCMFSRYVEVQALPDCTAETSARTLIEKIFYQNGAPKVILSDRGTNFTARLYRLIMKGLNIELRYTTPFHAQGDGATERANRTLTTMIRHYISSGHNDWEDLLPPLRFAYCNSVHESTNETPYFLVHGRDPLLLIDRILDVANDNPLGPQDFKSKLMQNLYKAYNLVKINLVKERKHQKEQYDKRV